MFKFLVALIFVTAATAQGSRVYRGGAVAAAHPAASAAATRVMEKGGNAVDAAVAAAWVMAVVGPYHSGLGGGGFAVVYDKPHAGETTLDFREVAPKAARRDMYLRDGKPVQALSTDGALAVAVPGAVAGYVELQERFGKLSRREVMAPAIELARKGFWVTPKYRALALQREDCLRQDSEAAAQFLRPLEKGAAPSAPAVGTLITQPALAKTLEGISAKGKAGFYAGPVAQAIASTVQGKGGLITLEDLSAYRTHERKPLTAQYRGHRIVTMPPPSAGGLTVLQVLGVLERAGTAPLASRDVPMTHAYIEALRRSYADRAQFLGDPAFVEVPLERLTSPAHLDEMWRSIDPKKATPSQALLPVPGESDGKHTTHISVIDKDGSAVALTTTINFYFGSCLVAKGTGVLLNDEMNDFAVQPGVPNAFGLVAGEANTIAPGKIPVSSMSPTLVFQKDKPTEVLLSVGSPGGSVIPTTVLQVITHIIDAQMDVQRAVAFGRLHHQYMPDELRAERFALSPSTQQALEALGHTVKVSEGWGDAEAVWVDPVTGLRSAASDPRNEGAPAGQD